MVTIRRANADDVSDIMDIMTTAHEAMEDPSKYITDDRDYVERHIDRDGLILMADVDGKPAGFFMVDIPGPGERNLGHYLGFPDDMQRQTVSMDSTAVYPEYQGYGIMKMLLTEVVSVISGEYPYMLGTVAPDNWPSRRSFEDCGFVLCKEIVKPMGQKRLLMYSGPDLPTLSTHDMVGDV